MFKMIKNFKIIMIIKLIYKKNKNMFNKLIKMQKLFNQFRIKNNKDLLN